MPRGLGPPNRPRGADWASASTAWVCAGAVEQFDAQIRTAQAAGARAVRVVMMPGRRYERFDSAEVLRKAKPEVRFTLEMITRDPLRVPCLTEKYWATMADVPGRELARTLRIVRAHAAPEPLPRVTHLAPDRQVAREEGNVRECLAYAREHLGL